VILTGGPPLQPPLDADNTQNDSVYNISSSKSSSISASKETRAAQREGITNSAVIRIKKGETDFDKSWILKADNLQMHSTIAITLVKNGKIYIQLPSEQLKPDFSNLANPIWDYYVVDINTLQATKITGMPHTRYAHSNEQCIVQMDGKIYLWMANSDTKENGYYLLNESSNTAAKTFNVTDGGLVSGFIKLDN